MSAIDTVDAPKVTIQSDAISRATPQSANSSLVVSIRSAAILGRAIVTMTSDCPANV
jgi:hypothetical protein